MLKGLQVQGLGWASRNDFQNTTRRATREYTIFATIRRPTGTKEFKNIPYL